MTECVQENQIKVHKRLKYECLNYFNKTKWQVCKVLAYLAFNKISVCRFVNQGKIGRLFAHC